jgi:hypothetical protein
VCRDFGCLIHKFLKKNVIGEVVINLSTGYYTLGRHQDALVMREETLEYMRRVLPENHPDICTLCVNLGKSYRKFGDFHRALEVAREALQINQPTLPPSDPR